MTGLLTVHLNGTVSEPDVHQWRVNLSQTLECIPSGSHIKLLADLTGYEPATLAAHKSMRSVIPLTQAAYGFRTRFFDFFEVSDVTITKTRDITITATAHVHHDAAKMAEYQARLGTDSERWFSDVDAARVWLMNHAG